MLEQALEYAEKGWSVFPVKAGDKRPITVHGHLDATRDAAIIRQWWAGQNHNIGINCERSGLIVLDVDPRHNGFNTLERLEQEHGELPDTANVLTGGGGIHLLFSRPEGDFKRHAGPGLDIKDHGYIIAPPSTHPSGERYRWINQAVIADLPVSWLPIVRRPDFKLQRNRQGNSATGIDRLKTIPAEEYVELLTGREVDDGWVQCPFHREGEEKTPSFYVRDNMWCCYACEPTEGKKVLGGNIYDLAGMVWGYDLPLENEEFTEIKQRLEGIL